MRKETRQIVRDPSSIAIGVVLPVMLILLFGYGLSLDVTERAGGGRPGRSVAGRHGPGGRLPAVAVLRRPAYDVDAAGANN